MPQSSVIAIYGNVWYLSYMMKTTVYLDEADLARLKAMARRERRPPAELIRLAISRFVENEVRELPKGAGAYHSGRSDVSASRKKIMSEAARKSAF